MTRHLSLDIIQRYLEPRGYIFEDFVLGTRNIVYTKITSPTNASIVLQRRGLIPPFTTTSAQGLFLNKSSMYDLARLYGINTPLTLAVARADYNLEQVSDFLNATEAVIVKPHNSYGSNGLTLDITTKPQLEGAIAAAFKFSSLLLVQRQFYGEEIRFLAVNGKVCAALIRRKAHVVGDGILSVSKLIARENQIRERIVDTYVAYPQLNAMLVEEELFNSEYIPAKDEVVELNKSTLIRGGASIYSILDQIHPSYIAMVESIAVQFGTGYLAIDLMFHDHTKAASKDNYVFLEVNTKPVLSMFYSCRDGKQATVVEDHIGPLFERLLS